MHNKMNSTKTERVFIGSDKRMALVKGYINEYKINNCFKGFK